MSGVQMFPSFFATSLNKQLGVILQTVEGITQAIGKKKKKKALFLILFLLSLACWDNYFKKCALKGFINPLDAIVRECEI